jgi:GT2 family glycosyltransferase
MARVAINIVTWNSLKFLPQALSSILSQTYRDFWLLVIDNGSSDGTADYIRRDFPEAGVLRNVKNLGFTRAHNQGITYAKAHLDASQGDPLVLITNPDIILEPDFLEKMVAEMDRRPDAGSAGGKLLKVFERGDGEVREAVKTNMIDSTGVRMTRSRRAIDRGAGELDERGRFDRLEEIFGVSGAIALYRLKALEDVAYRDEYFDDDFFAYKEDLDLAWRLRLRGWSSLYVPSARAYHYRTAAGREKASVREIISGRRGRSKTVNFLSYRNHLLMLAKNDQWQNSLLHWPWIWWYEIRKFLYVLFLEPATFGAFISYLRLLPRAIAKRRLTMSRRKVRAKDIRRWFR